MSKLGGMLWTAAVVLGLAACGGGDGGGDAASPPPPPTGSMSTQRGTLVSAKLVQTLTPSQFTAGLSSNANGQLLLGLTGPPTCTISVYHIEYWTVAPAPVGGGTAPPTQVSAAVIVPSGTGAPCSGPRPLVLNAHGSNADPTFNMADLDSSTSNIAERELAPAFFATQGYIIVSPNYAGYDISTLDYYPWLNADQNSKDMMDALTAATTALSGPLASATTYSGKLFVMGYSLGGYVAMATDKAMQAAGIKVTATAPMAGLYATEAWADATFLGNTLGPATMAWQTTSYQNAYGNVYSSLTDIYPAAYAAYITTDFKDQSENLLPAAMFDAAPPPTGNAQLDALLQPSTDLWFSEFFGNPYMVNDSYRQSYVADVIAHPDGAIPQAMPGAPLAMAPQNKLRQDLQLNDMRSWTPQMPMLLCSGRGDHQALFLNTQAMAAYWSAQVAQGLVTVVDVDAPPAAGDPYAVEQTGFQQYQAQVAADHGTLAAIQAYHGVEAYYCMQAARQFFAQF